MPLDVYTGSYLTKCALQLLALTFMRGIELRGARWEELSLEESLWRILGERMKMKLDHLVPLSRQSVNLLEDLKSVTGHCVYLFSSRRSDSRTMSENTITGAMPA